MARFSAILSGAVIAVLALSATAFGETVHGRGYGGPGADIQEEIVAARGADILPFSGLDLALLVGGGLMLLLVGLLVRRATRAG
jgi:hypothetical protein